MCVHVFSEEDTVTPWHQKGLLFFRHWCNPKCIWHWALGEWVIPSLVNYAVFLHFLHSLSATNNNYYFLLRDLTRGVFFSSCSATQHKRSLTYSLLRLKYDRHSAVSCSSSSSFTPTRSWAHNVIPSSSGFHFDCRPVLILCPAKSSRGNCVGVMWAERGELSCRKSNLESLGCWVTSLF